MNNKFRQLLCIGMASLMALPFAGSANINVASAGSSLDGEYKVESTANTYPVPSAANSAKYNDVKFENVTGKVDLTAVQIANFNSSVMKNESVANEERTVIISLDEPAVIKYLAKGASVADYLATPAGKSTLSRINASQNAFLTELNKSGIDYSVVDSFNVTVNAIALEINTQYLSTLKAIGSVTSAVVSETYAFPETVDAQINPSNVYKTGIYDSSDCEYQGDGMTVAILDTGLDYTHEAYSVMPTGPLGLTKDEVSEKMDSLKATVFSQSVGDTLTVDDVYISDKVPFAYDYADDDADVYPAYSQHGVHVAGIVAGQADSYTDNEGNLAVDENGDPITFRGSAPNAQLVICKVFTDELDSKDIGGATSEDILAALEDCVTLGVDVINMSLGTSAGFSTIYGLEGDSEGELLNRVYESIRDQGISLMCAASNDYSSGFGGSYGTNLRTNPDSGTVGSPSTFVGAMSVASINGVQSPYMIGNGEDAIFYYESSDANGVQNNFSKEMLGNKKSETFKYVVIPDIGEAKDYTSIIRSKLADKGEAGKVIALVKRGATSFQEKVELAALYADAIVVYNNVAGTVRMNLGDIIDPIPAISVSIDAGTALVNKAVDSVGYLEINTDYFAGPFMNDYSSWGATPDLKLKPDVTSHGGDIISTVAGGYEQMSGTSMATPNLAGLTALMRQYAVDKFPEYADDKVGLSEFVNQLMMSTAETVYTETGLPYSPRKQGSGLATIQNIFSSNAYLYTLAAEGGAEENRPKAELGYGMEGVYNIKFHASNFGTQALEFTAKSMLFTETLAIGGMAVAEKAYMLGGSPVWKVDGTQVQEGSVITLAPGQDSVIEVTLTLSDADKKYIMDSFPNGMYVEGFIKLESKSDEQCDLNLPFMGFYGDWTSAPMLDYDCYEIADIEKDKTTNDNEKEKASVWATQAYSMYYNAKYTLPLGGYVYLQDENSDKVYTNRDYASISCFNDYYGETSTQNYMTSTGIKALYAGLLRNAELVTFDLYDAETNELIKSDRVFRVGKAYAAGGANRPAQVLMEYTPADLGLTANGKYKLDFRFYFNYEDEHDPEKQIEDNTFSMVFYVDYEAPIVEDMRIRYYNYKDGNKEKQRVYLDIDVFDNHYPQAVLLCYADTDAQGELNLKLATEYITPVLNPTKNSTNTVSIEITNFYEKYKGRLYVQIDDYSLNHNVYSIDFATANKDPLPSDFSIISGTVSTDKAGNKVRTMEVGVNETAKIALDYEGNANLSNFIWTSNKQSTVKVKNGEIFGVKEGSAVITVSNGSKSEKITVNVVASNKTLNLPIISFGMIENYNLSLQKAQGVVDVNAGQTFKLDIETDPWYYPVENLTFKWTTSDESVATVDSKGTVKTQNKRGSAVIRAVIMNGEAETIYSSTVILNVGEPFQVSNMMLTKYYGTEKTVVIPDDENIMYIGEDAFEDNEYVEKVIIPKTVVYINERAFINCKNLKEVYFISEEKQDIADSKLSIIYRYAFQGCTSLKKVDFSNVKIATLDISAFEGCTALEEVVCMNKIGKMDSRAFYGCSSLKEADVSGLHTSGSSVFENCTSLNKITTAKYTVLGSRMFAGCSSLESVTFNMSNPIPASAFEKCGKLSTVSFGAKDSSNIVTAIGNKAFKDCVSLAEVNFNNNEIKSIGDQAFSGCEKLTQLTLCGKYISLGKDVFTNSPTTINLPNEALWKMENGALYYDNILVIAPSTVAEDWQMADGTTVIAPYAFENSTFEAKTFTIPSSVYQIGTGAFINVNLESIVLSSVCDVIPAQAFMGSSLKSVTIPACVWTIGESAFKNSALESVEFENGAKLHLIAKEAFSGTKLVRIEIPGSDSEEYCIDIGDMAFAHCRNLASAEIYAVGMGYGVFIDTPALTTVEFGDNMSDLGTYTFANAQHSYDVNSGSYVERKYGSSLKTVNIPSKVISIRERVFYNCDKLEAIDLTNVIYVMDYAFYGCSKLSSVIGIETVERIEQFAFYDCIALTEMTLTDAWVIGDYAFANYDGTMNLATVSIPNAREIGDFAFYGNKLSSITIPETVNEIGIAAFAKNKNLTAYTVDDDNRVFFTDEDGVLYRKVFNFINEDISYELVAYPTAHDAPFEDSEETNKDREYSVLEGTSTIKELAFTNLNDNTVDIVKLPYSVKTIGNMAFYRSGITEYVFESINAPVLLTENNDNGILPQTQYGHSLINANFEESVYLYALDLFAEVGFTGFEEYGIGKSALKAFVPTNGVGYDNFMYRTYFPTVSKLGELMNDTTRSLKNTIEAFYDADEVAEWAEWEITADNKATVQDFASKVKSAHGTYNNLKNNTVQVGFLGEENVQKLFDIERELKAVKDAFGISAKVKSLSVSSDSVYKSQYVEGEKFDVSGVKLIVEYDDYYTEEADMTKITVANTAGLTIYNRYVELRGYGKSVRVAVTVTKAPEPVSYTVKFMNGTVEIASVTVIEGNVVEKPATDPTKAADNEYTYAFSGWYNGDTEWNFETAITANLTLSAKFTATAIEPEPPAGDDTPDTPQPPADGGNKGGCAGQAGQILLLVSALCGLMFVGKKIGKM